MMQYDWNYQMMNGHSVFMFLIWLVMLADLILLGVWLWKLINKS